MKFGPKQGAAVYAARFHALLQFAPNSFPIGAGEGPNVLDFIAGLAWDLLRGGGSRRLAHSGRDRWMVSNLEKAGDRSAERGLRSCMDPALRSDGRCRLAGLAVGTVSVAHRGHRPIHGATDAEPRLVVAFLPQT